jgi:hypothetical protein
MHHAAMKIRLGTHPAGWVVIDFQILERFVNALQSILHTSSDMAALEVGGGPWWTTWKNFSELTGPQASVVGLPVDVASAVESLPIRLPGL